MAVHDAAARAMAVPLHVLLGGCFRDRVRVYVSSIWVDPAQPEPALEATERYIAEGYTAIKYYGWPGFGADPGRDSALLQQVRQRAGQGVDLMLDLGRPGCLEEAVQLARMIEDSGARIYWWEEPLSSTDDPAALACLRTRTDLAIAAGEQEMTAFAFRDLIQKEAVGVLQPDLSWVGGLTEGRRIAALARLHRVPLVPHNWGTAVNFAASIHLVAAMPRGFLCEYPITPRLPGAQQPSPMMTELARTPVVVEGGYARVPQGPGLGIELDETAVARYTCA
jgi:L-alanine-DL-glutamate epimerase-like enolase superfamily enzyme